MATDPMAGEIVQRGTEVYYLVSVGGPAMATLEPSGEPLPGLTAEPTADPVPAPTAATILEPSSSVHWDAFRDRIKPFAEIALDTIAALSLALETGNVEQTSTLAGTLSDASRELLAWLDDNPPDPCYRDSWQSFHRAAGLVAVAADRLAAEGLDAAAAGFIPAGSALISAGGTLVAASDACRTSTGSADCESWLAGSGLVTVVASGFTMAAPANWRRLEPGDSGWRTLFGANGSWVERSVAAGDIQDFIVPVEPPDPDRSVNLAVYVRDAPAGASPAMLADRIVDRFRSHESIIEVADPVELTLPAGSAARVAAIRTELPGEAPKRDVIDTYVLIHDGRSYELGFISSEATADRYGQAFGCMMESVRWMPAGPSQQPSPSGSAP